MSWNYIKRFRITLLTEARSMLKNIFIKGLMVVCILLFSNSIYAGGFISPTPPTFDERLKNQDREINHTYYGGGILGAYSLGYNAIVTTIESVSNNLFNDNVITGDSIFGGGIVGITANDTAGTSVVSIGDIRDRIFSGNKINAIEVRCGGIIGTRDGTIGNIVNNIFDSNEVTTTSTIVGGGIVGGEYYSTIGDISDDTFTNNTISASRIMGGGIIGLYDSSKFSKTVAFNKITNNTITFADDLIGGGVIGAVKNSTINESYDNIISNNTVSLSKSVHGGGILGVNDGSSHGKIEKSYFDGNNVSVATDLYGGGIVGVDKNSKIGNIFTNSFTKNKISSDSNLIVSIIGNGRGAAILGGGILGGYDNSSIGTITDTNFAENDIIVHYLYGGGIIGVNTNASIAGINKNSIDNNVVYANSDDIYGGGIVGATVVSTFGTSSNNVFKNNTVAIKNSIHGGGIFGANSSSFIGTASNYQFSANNVTAGSDIIGGGIVGVDNESRIGNINSNGWADTEDWVDLYIADLADGDTTGHISGKFTGNTVLAGGCIYGGGVIGANANSIIDAVKDSEFSSNSIAAAKISGGGIVGSRDVSAIHGVSKSIFKNNTVQAPSLYGGGIIGASYGGSTSSVEDSIIDHNTVLANNNATTSFISGGGIIGADDAGILAYILNNKIINNTISTSGSILGGGIIGFNDYSNNSIITGNMIHYNTITANSVNGGGLIGVHSNSVLGSILTTYLNGNHVVSANDIHGGGIIGASSDSNIGELIDVGVTGSTVTAKDIYGGGIIGANNTTTDILASHVGDLRLVNITGNKVSAANIYGGGIIGGRSSTIGNIANTVFDSNEVTTTAMIVGGGIVGGEYHSTVGDIIDDTFTNNTISASRIVGGGILGAWYDSTIGKISGSTFDHNTITANGAIDAGILFSQNSLTITDSRFTNNTFTSKQWQDPADIYGGAVTIDTSVADGTETLSLTIAATAGHTTIFQNNEINDVKGKRTNSISIRPVGAYLPTSRAHVVLTIDTAADGATYLYDPIYVEQNNGKTFTMEVTNGGEFYWGGDNKIIVDAVDAKNSIMLTPYSTTALLSGFNLDAPKHSFTLNEQAGLIVPKNTSITANSVSLNGQVKFDMKGVQANLSTLAMLEIIANKISITSSHFDFALPGDAQPLRIGDRYYLIHGSVALSCTSVSVGSTQTIKIGSTLESTVQFKEDGTNTIIAEVIGNTQTQSANTPASAMRASLNVANGESMVPDALTIRADVPEIPDTTDISEETPNIDDPTIYEDEEDITRAAFTKLNELGDLYGATRAVNGAKSLTNGVLGGVALSTQGADLVASAAMDNAVEQAGHGKWGVFGAVRAGYLKYNNSMNMSSINLATGISRNMDTPIGDLVTGVFFEYGGASFDTKNSIGDSQSVKGEGNTSYVGAGMLGRMDFNRFGDGHLYTEAALRYGLSEDGYNSKDLTDAWGTRAKYETSAVQYGGHVGIGYVWNITDEASLDVYGKYFYLHQDKNQLTLSTGEPVSFDAVDSNRIRGGAKFRYEVSEYVTPYVGIAYETELTGNSEATIGSSVKLRESSLKGETAIGELGLVMRPSKNPWTIDLGVQGYTGKREGIGGSLRVGYEF